jgi:hypothetical protein
MKGETTIKITIDPFAVSTFEARSPSPKGEGGIALYIEI